MVKLNQGFWTYRESLICLVIWQFVKILFVDLIYYKSYITSFKRFAKSVKDILGYHKTVLEDTQMLETI